MAEIRELKGDADLEEALSGGVVVLYKHSPWCGLSTAARHEILFFAEGNPDIPIYQVDVIHQRTLSQKIEQLMRIEHESPQVILVRDGQPVSWASHRGVTAHAIERELERLTGRARPEAAERRS